MSYGDGKDFESEFRKSARHLGIWIHRLEDATPQPADYQLVKDGKSCLCELKSTHQERYPLSQLQSHQLFGLLEHERLGKGTSQVVIRFYRQKLNGGSGAALYAIRVEKYRQLLMEGEKSLNREEIGKAGREIERMWINGRLLWRVDQLWRK